MNLQNIGRKNLNNENLPFVDDFVYGIEHKDITGLVWQANPANFEAANAVAFADLTFNGSLKKFAISELKGKLNGELQGDVGGHYKKHLATISFDGTTKEILGWEKVSNNAKMVFFLRDKNGQFRALGNDKFPATKESGNDSTGDDGEMNGVVQTWISHGPGPALVVDATVADFEGILDDSLSASASY